MHIFIQKMQNHLGQPTPPYPKLLEVSLSLLGETGSKDLKVGSFMQTPELILTWRYGLGAASK